MVRRAAVRSTACRIKKSSPSTSTGTFRNRFHCGQTTCALPEILGDAAMMVDPAQPADIARGALAVIRDAGVRGGLVARGLERARRYRWEETARRTLAVFQEVCCTLRS